MIYPDQTLLGCYMGVVASDTTSYKVQQRKHQQKMNITDLLQTSVNSV
jgi:hypothetical protein